MELSVTMLQLIQVRRLKKGKSFPDRRYRIAVSGSNINNKTRGNKLIETSSMKMERISRMLEEVGLRDGIRDLRLSHEGTAALQLTGGKKVFFEYQQEEALLFLYMPVLGLPANTANRLAMMEAMLDRNFLKLGTGKGELSIQREKKEAVYQVALDTATLTADKLDRAIDDLLKEREECRHALERARPSAADKPPVSQDNGRAQLLVRLGRR